MLTVTTKVEFNHLPQIANNLPAAAKRLVKTEAAAVWQDTIANIHKYDAIDTGTMWKSTLFRAIDEFTWEVIVPVHYAVYVNYGTHRMAARPFFTEAIEVSKTRFPQRFVHLV